MALEWTPENTTPDGRYAINTLTSASGRTEWFLGRSPRLVVEQNIRYENGKVLLDENDQPILDQVIVQDDTPLPCGSLDEAKRQAQAIEDGTIDEFEEARQVGLRAQRAERAEREAEVAAVIAFDRRSAADSDLPDRVLKQRRTSILRALRDRLSGAEALHAHLYRDEKETG